MRAMAFVMRLLCLLAFLEAEGEAQSRSQKVALSEIVSIQSKYPKQIRSLQARFRAENHLTPAYLQKFEQARAAEPEAKQTPLPAAVQRWDVVYSCRGDRYLWEERPEEPVRGGGWPAKFCDGKDTYYLVYAISRATGKEQIDSATRSKGVTITFPHVLSFGYQLEENLDAWIGKLLQQGEYRLIGTETDPQFGTLYRVQGSFQNDEATFWFAPQYGCLAVRAERKPRDGKGTRRVYRITRLQKVDGLWFAQSAERENYDLPGDWLRTRYTLDVTSLKLNAAPASLFRLTVPPGATFMDREANVMYTVGPKGKRIGH